MQYNQGANNMKNHVVKVFAVVAAVMFLSITVLELNAHARAGGSRSFGSRGTRSYSRPTTPYSQPSQQRQQAAPAPNQFQQQAGGGFMRSMAGGIMGGMLGGMLFRSLGMAGGGMGGGGIGLFEILLLAGIGYLIYRFVKKKHAANPTYSSYEGGYQGGTVTPIPASYQVIEPANDLAAGLAHIRQMDASFDEDRFNDLVMDNFFKIQGAWMNRDLAPVNGLLTDEMKRIFQEDLDRLLRDRQVNRLENIAVRNVEIAEVWQESGQDFITTLIYANLLDYTTDDATGAVVSGSKTEPVKFEEYWTFTRPVGNNPWRLSAINQK
jgi:predicted lipid-binding transport protein (Tim44 family)